MGGGNDEERPMQPQLGGGMAPSGRRIGAVKAGALISLPQRWGWSLARRAIALVGDDHAS